MDGERFDTFARTLASGINRRRILRVVAGGLASAALSLIGGVAEAARCRDNGHTCSKHAHCCSSFCSRPRRTRPVCADCKSEIICGNICCPPEALNGCTEINGPNGPVIGCICPEGTRYDRAANKCHPCGGADRTCRSDDDCCSGTCCGGVCCAGDSPYCCGETCCAEPCCGGRCCPPESPNCCNGACSRHDCCDVVACADKDDACCGGVCVPSDECHCPPGTACSGSATCTSFGETVTVDCCAYPQHSYCCGDSAPGVHDGISGCCSGNDCPDGCPNGAAKAIGGTSGVCCGIDNDYCADVRDCCLQGVTPGGDASVNQNCILSGHPCDRDWPCCGKCVSGVCTCRQKGEPSQGHGGQACCSGHVDLNYPSAEAPCL